MNEYRKQIAFEIEAERALFADPASKVGKEKISYPFPTYEALKGVLKAIYWKPTITWYVDAVRVMSPIQMETECTKLVKLINNDGDLAFNTYLRNVKYQVLAHYEWNLNRPEFKKDRDFKKYNEIIRRYLKKRRNPIHLGTSECIAEVEPCEFGDGKGAYDNAGMQMYGLMYHGLTYPDEAYNDDTRDRKTLNFFIPKMVNGVVEFPRPEDCPVHYPLHKCKMKVFPADVNRGDDE